VTADIERELRTVFEDASQFVTPRPGLADRIRRRAAHRRRAALAIAAAAAVLATGAGYLTLAGAGRPVPATGHHPVKRHGPLAITAPGGTDALAVGGPVLYVATGEDFPGAALSAYNRANGHLIRRIQIPSTPRSLAVGPGGSVWLTFYQDQGSGRDGVWLLSPDLRQHSSLDSRQATRLGLDDILPIGATDALVHDSGLADLHMPPPGRPGRAALRQVAAIPPDGRYGGTMGFTRLAGRVALLQNDALRSYRIVFAGASRQVFAAGAGVTINSMAAGGNGLWITTSTPASSTSTGGVVRLDDQLDVVTPRSLRTSTTLAFPAGVWATGDTVWVITQSTSRSLFCFRFRNGAGPVVNVPARLPPSDLAVTADTVYAADAFGVTSYRVPAACH
jgi:hypothetical protein